MHKCDEQKKCVNDALAKAESVCQERGLRFTEIRKFILRLITIYHNRLIDLDKML